MSRDAVAVAAARAQARELPIRFLLDDGTRIGPFRVVERLADQPPIDGCTVAVKLEPWFSNDLASTARTLHLGNVKSTRLGGPR